MGPAQEHGLVSQDYAARVNMHYESPAVAL
jgi:hypothetical protein